MEVIVCATADEGSDLAAKEVLGALAKKPALVLGLATGSTPLGLYRRMIDACRAGEADFSRVFTFNLDEYLRLPPGHPQSYRAFMDEHLFGHIDIPEDHIHFPPTHGTDISGQCEDFEREIRRLGGIDIQILGIGADGHIGFNEPTSSLGSRTRPKTLMEETLRDNARFFCQEDSQPDMAVTMGIGTILESRRILLMAFGTTKVRAIQSTIEGPLSNMYPASALQLHANVTVIVDEQAAAGLAMREYYKRVYRNKLSLGGIVMP
ncbi:MAG: glucosamine-6-phosphate deaminase [Planctomycetes bacterium]|nr:glucosamine-6-phosphate deaminase [Planctomycetota bacterium]